MPHKLGPAQLDFTDKVLGLNVRGRIGRFVYQGTSEHLANAATLFDKRRQKRNRVSGHNPETPPQLAQREKLRSAVAGWQSLEPHQKAVYNRVRGSRGYTCRYGHRHVYHSGYQLYISLRLNGKRVQD